MTRTTRPKNTPLWWFAYDKQTKETHYALAPSWAEARKKLGGDCCPVEVTDQAVLKLLYSGVVRRNQE